MATISFCGENYAVDHAVKGANYIHGYDASGVCIVSFENVGDLSAITYDGEYMKPEECATEACNKVVYCGGKLQTLGGAAVNKSVAVKLPANGWADNAQTVTVEGVTADAIVIVSAAPASREVYGESGVYCSAQSAGALTFTCEDTPGADVTANVVILA